MYYGICRVLVRELGALKTVMWCVWSVNSVITWIVVYQVGLWLENACGDQPLFLPHGSLEKLWPIKM